MRAERRLRRLEESYRWRALQTLTDDELLLLMRFARRVLRDGVDSITPQHQTRAIALLTLLVGECQ